MTAPRDVDVAIVGAGILGLAHAVHAVRAGLSVAVFERSPKAQGASIRNFGMLAVVAQAPGPELESARQALVDWQDIAAQAGVNLRRAGCLFVARSPEEMRVLEEAAASGGDGPSLTLIPRRGLPDRAEGLRTEALLGGLWSPDAWKVDQRLAVGGIADWLRREHGVAFHFSTEVRAVGDGCLHTSAGRFAARRTVLCAGDAFEELFPDEFRASGVGRCQLQMLRTPPQPGGWRLVPFVLGGLSLPRYSLFASCAGLPALREHQRMHLSTHLEHGVHVIACQELDGSITIGDSHAYGAVEPAARSKAVDRLILDELSRIIALPEPRIAERWLGHYASMTDRDVLILNPAEGVTAVTVTNGQGMTHAFSVARTVIGGLAS